MDPRAFWVNVAVVVIKPLLIALTKRDMRGKEHVPASGGAIVCFNHISYSDPLASALFVYDSGRIPRFLAKASLFKLPLAGRVLAGARQIPVYRDSRNASTAFGAAVHSVRAGQCVCVYPESTLTRDPALWPMQGKTGAARIALATGAPVIPVAQWGAHELLPPYARKPRLLPRVTLRFLAGPPVDLTDLRGRELTADVLREATDRIMTAITELLAELRPGELPPVHRFDPRSLRTGEETR